MSKEVKIMLGIAVLVIAAGIFLLFKTGTNSTTSGLTKEDARLVASDSHIFGKSSAKVTVVEFGDYQCPACGYEYPILKQVLDAYKDKDFNFVFRNFPLTSIHKNAMISAEAAEAAGAQGKYWEMYDKLYEGQATWAESNSPLDVFIQYAKELGLDSDKLAQEVKDNKYQEKIQKDVSDGTSLGVAGTPTIYVNGVKMSGSPSLETLKTEIDNDLSK